MLEWRCSPRQIFKDVQPGEASDERFKFYNILYNSKMFEAVFKATLFNYLWKPLNARHPLPFFILTVVSDVVESGRGREALG